MRKTKQSSWLVVWIGVAMGMLVLASACTTPQEEDTVVQGADQLKQALPSAAEMSIRVPDSSALVAEQATFYKFTREVSLGINRFVWAITHLIEEITELAPSDTDGASYAVWGPFQDALAPATWQVRVDRVAEGSYRYVVQGWPRGQDIAAARTVLEGTHEERPGVHRGVGTWTYHMTVARELDPIAHDSIGDVSVAYDIGDARNLEVSFAGVQGPHDPVVIDALYRYTEAEDGSGTFDFISNLDVDREENPARDRRELVQVRSRWLARGDGRSDVLASHGDLPQGMKADVIECWDNAFVRTYVSYAVAADRSEEGDAASCPYADRQLPTFAGFDPDAFADGDLVAAVPVPDDFAAGLAPIEEPVAEPASLYLLTRTMIEGVNAQVKNVLAMLEEGLEHPPSDCEPDRCTWGPWTDFATGVTARLVVTRLGEGRFGFASEVKLFGGAEDSWAALFRGEMTESDAGAAGEDDGEGWFVFDLDVLHALNPEEMLGGSFRAELLRQGGQLRIAVRFDQVVSAERPEPADVRYLLQVQPDGAGSLDLQFSGDIDEGNPARPGVELVQMHSRWVAGGAGMASARVTGGDIEPGQEWLSVQCWDEHAAPTHERMMPQAAGGEGRPPIDAQQCIHDDWVDPSFPPMADEQE